jgi:DNA-binding GntR family transcriptional regulator
MLNLADKLTETLPGKIASAIADRIVDGTYPGGSRLVESKLSKEFGISHGPVRDALRQLQNLGLVTIHPYRGAEVTAFSVREIKEVYQVRAALVGLRARWIAEEPQRFELLFRIEGLVADLEELAGRDAAEYTKVALSLGQIMTENLTNTWLRSVLMALALQTSRYSRLALSTPERQKQSSLKWARLLKALKAGDGDLAEKIATTLSLETRDAAIKYLDGAAPAVRPQSKNAATSKNTRRVARAG